MDKFQLLALKKSVTVYEAAQLLAQGSGGESAAESLIKEAIILGEIAADGLHPERHLEDFSFHDQHGINIMGTTVLRADLDPWLASKGLSIDLMTPVAVPNLKPAEVPVSKPQAAPTSGTGWTLKKPQRSQGYGLPLYGVLKAAHTAGLPRPTARFVLDEFAKNKHPVILCVSSDSLDYQNGNGEKVTANLDAIRVAIGRLARIADDSHE